VNALFSELVTLCSTSRGDRVLDCPQIRAIMPSLHRLCGEGEYELEREWALRVIDSGFPVRELARFPYYDNYRKLVDLEVHALFGLGYTRLRSAAFIGSGPLPLSAILLANRFGLAVDSIDRKPEAHALAVKATDRLGLGAALRFHRADLLEFSSLKEFEIVFLAALVGADRAEKRRIVRHLAAHMRPGALLVVRTAHQLRSLLYPHIRLEDLSGFAAKLVLHPLNEVINSVIVTECTGG
jgi:nicotianamine synthase